VLFYWKRKQMDIIRDYSGLDEEASRSAILQEWCCLKTKKSWKRGREGEMSVVVGRRRRVGTYCRIRSHWKASTRKLLHQGPSNHRLYQFVRFFPPFSFMCPAITGSLHAQFVWGTKALNCHFPPLPQRSCLPFS
jgi:hypothetical protein